MALPKTANAFDAAADLAREEVQPEGNEYMAGEVFAMDGVRQSHNVATLDLATLLRRELKGSARRVFIESARARVEVFRRNLENHWVLYDYGLGDCVEIASPTLRLDVGELLEDTHEDVSRRLTP